MYENCRSISTLTSMGSVELLHVVIILRDPVNATRCCRQSTSKRHDLLIMAGFDYKIRQNLGTIFCDVHVQSTSENFLLRVIIFLREFLYHDLPQAMNLAKNKGGSFHMCLKSLFKIYNSINDFNSFFTGFT